MRYTSIRHLYDLKEYYTTILRTKTWVLRTVHYPARQCGTTLQYALKNESSTLQTTFVKCNCFVDGSIHTMLRMTGPIYPQKPRQKTAYP